MKRQAKIFLSTVFRPLDQINLVLNSMGKVFLICIRFLNRMEQNSDLTAFTPKIQNILQTRID